MKEVFLTLSTGDFGLCMIRVTEDGARGWLYDGRNEDRVRATLRDGRGWDLLQSFPEFRPLVRVAQQALKEQDNGQG